MLYRADDGRMVPLETDERGFDHRSVLAALADQDDANLLQLCVRQLPDDAWRAKSLLARACWPALVRTEIAATLRTFRYAQED